MGPGCSRPSGLRNLPGSHGHRQIRGGASENVPTTAALPGAIGRQADRNGNDDRPFVRRSPHCYCPKPLSAGSIGCACPPLRRRQKAHQQQHGQDRGRVREPVEERRNRGGAQGSSARSRSPRRITTTGTSSFSGAVTLLGNSSRSARSVAKAMMCWTLSLGSPGMSGRMRQHRHDQRKSGCRPRTARAAPRLPSLKKTTDGAQALLVLVSRPWSFRDFLWRRPPAPARPA